MTGKFRYLLVFGVLMMENRKGICKKTSLEWANTSFGNVAYQNGDCPAGEALRRFGQIMPDLTVLLLRILRKGDVVVDIGSGTGALAVAMCHAVSSNGTVHLFDTDSMSLDATFSALGTNAKHHSVSAAAGPERRGTPAKTTLPPCRTTFRRVRLAMPPSDFSDQHQARHPRNEAHQPTPAN